MLDQNTDRMWYVIGALVVGAGIILLANKAMPEIFASVAKTFEDKTEDVSGVISTITVASKNFENTMDLSNVSHHRWVDPVTGNLTVQAGDDHSATGFIPVVGGNTYVVSGNNGLHNPSVVYYDSAKNYITGKKTDGDNLRLVESVAPDNAAYVRISARNSSLSGRPSTSSYMENWTFRQILVNENEVM